MNRLPTALSHNRPRALSLCLSITLFLLASIPAVAQEAQSRAVEEPDSASKASGSITGRVLGDDGRPIADVLVYIYVAYASMSPRGSVTDTGGRFQFKDLPPGLYSLRVNAPAYVELPDENRSAGEPRYIRPGESPQLTLVKGGVITGTVSNAQGEPLIAANVRAIRVRDVQGRRIPTELGNMGQPRMTDDRGIYRIYGLQPGSYIVLVGGNYPYFNMFNPYEADAPTYYPSSTRDTAAEVSVRAGEEATGIDIRYRNERGHAISGTVAGMPGGMNRYGLNVMLSRASIGTLEAQTFVPDTGGRRVFSLNGVPDGEYELVAQGFFDKGEVLASAPRKITVRGSDVTGLQLELTALASVAGRVTLEPSQDEACPKLSPVTAMQQTLVTVRRDDWGKERQQPSPFSSTSNIPNEQGEFVTRNLDGGIFRLSVRPPGDDWYVRAVTLPSPALTPGNQSKPSEVKASVPAAFGTFPLKRGERASGIAVNLAQGAASLSGRVTVQGEGTSLPPNLRAYLVPVERERADDILRYSETNVTGSGTFIFTSLAPGRYWLIIRPVSQSEFLQTPRMLAWDEGTRKALRREAEAAGNTVELKPCQRLTDYALSYAPK